MSATTCKTCKGARLKPEALAVTVGGLNIAELTTMSVEKAESLLPDLRADAARGADRAPDPQGSARAARLSSQRGSRLPQLVALGDHALRRRIAAHPVGDADRLVARRRAVHPRRAVDRTASARQRPAARDPQDAARSRQHADRDRARRGYDARGRRDRRHRPGRGRRGRPHLSRSERSTTSAQPRIADRRVSFRAAVHRDSQARRKPRGWLGVRKAKANNIDGIDVEIPIGVFAA
jgi:excinuclease ABC subunit A